MVGKLSNLVAVGLGLALAAIATPAWARGGPPAHAGGPPLNAGGPSKGNDDSSSTATECAETPLGVLSNFCELRSGNDDGYGLPDSLLWLGEQSPGEWSKLDKIDVPKGSTGTLTGDYFNLTLKTELEGTWSFLNIEDLLAEGYTEFAIAIKGAQNHIMYGYDLASYSSASGDSGFRWSTEGLTNNGGNQPDLSHSTVFVKRALPPPLPKPIPEPAALLGLAVVGGMVASLKRKRPTAD